MRQKQPRVWRGNHYSEYVALVSENSPDCYCSHAAWWLLVNCAYAIVAAIPAVCCPSVRFIYFGLFRSARRHYCRRVAFISEIKIRRSTGVHHKACVRITVPTDIVYQLISEFMWLIRFVYLIIWINEKRITDDWWRRSQSHALVLILSVDQSYASALLNFWIVTETCVQA